MESDLRLSSIEIPNRHLLQILKTVPWLENLEIANCQQLDQTTIVKARTYLSELVRIDISNQNSSILAVACLCSCSELQQFIMYGQGPRRGKGWGGLQPPHFFGNLKELLRKRYFQPPHFESLFSPPTLKVAPWALAV